MFCPKCGNDCPDNATFCNKCGHKIGERKQQSAGTPTQVVKPARSVPIIPIVAVVAVILVAVLGFGIFGQKKPTPPDSRASPEAPTTEQKTTEDSQKELSVREEQAKRIGPTEKIEITKVELKEDTVKRYVITGTATNKGSEAYDIDLAFAAKVHSPDRYGEEATTMTALSFDAITRYADTGSSSATLTDFINEEEFKSIDGFSASRSSSALTLYNVPAGQSVDFAIYPTFDSLEMSLSDPQCFVSKVSLPDADENWRFDRDEGIKIDKEKMSLSADGKLTVPFTNETGLYLSSVEIRLVPYNKDKLPAVKSNNGARPTGAILSSAKVDLVKPGDQSEFVIQIGEGYHHVDVLDTIITPDKDKNSFN